MIGLTSGGGGITFVEGESGFGLEKQISLFQR